jgi:hypothetical protein
VWIYCHGRRAGPWLAQGIRFGAAIWAVAIVPLYLTNYTIEPWPGIFVAKILTWELLVVVTLGILTAALAKDDSGAKDGSHTFFPFRGRQDANARQPRRRA